MTKEELDLDVSHNLKLRPTDKYFLDFGGVAFKARDMLQNRITLTFLDDTSLARPQGWYVPGY